MPCGGCGCPCSGGGGGGYCFHLNEAFSLLRNVDLTLGTDEVTALYKQTEGWAAGLYLGALYLKEGGSVGRAAASFAGADACVRREKPTGRRFKNRNADNVADPEAE